MVFARLSEGDAAAVKDYPYKLMSDSLPANDDRLLESALAFWRDAGLEVCVEDGPVDRINQPPPVRRPASVTAAAPVASTAPISPRRR